jgi:hypothetical protein
MAALALATCVLWFAGGLVLAARYWHRGPRAEVTDRLTICDKHSRRALPMHALHHNPSLLRMTSPSGIRHTPMVHSSARSRRRASAPPRDT